MEMEWHLPDEKPELRSGNGWFEPLRDVIVTDVNNRVYIAFFCNDKFNWHSTEHPVEIKAWMYLPEAYGWQPWYDKHCGDCIFAQPTDRDLFVKCDKGNGIIGDGKRDGELGKFYDCRRKITSACDMFKEREDGTNQE